MDGPHLDQGIECTPYIPSWGVCPAGACESAVTVEKEQGIPVSGSFLTTAILNWWRMSRGKGSSAHVRFETVSRRDRRWMDSANAEPKAFRGDMVSM